MEKKEDNYKENLGERKHQSMSQQSTRLGKNCEFHQSTKLISKAQNWVVMILPRNQVKPCQWVEPT